jgi:hypothetical protein
MENLNYIHINNDNFKNNFNRNAITPKVNLKEVNSISPKYKNVNFKNNITTYSQQEKINFNFIEENNEKSINNKIRLLNGYSNLNSSLNEDNQYKPSNQYKHNSSVSLKKIQNEIKVIEMKLRSDIIKSKIKQLSDISEDNKHKNKLMYKNNIYNSKSNKIFINRNKTQNNNKFYKIKKIRNNSSIRLKIPEYYKVNMDRIGVYPYSHCEKIDGFTLKTIKSNKSAIDLLTNKEKKIFLSKL